MIGPAVAEPLTLEVIEASVAYGAGNSTPVMTFRMSESSSKAFAEFSARHAGEKVDIRVDGRSMMQPVIREPIKGGVGQIIASSPDEARQVAGRLASKGARLDVEALP